MRRIILFALVGITLALTSQTAQAGWYEFWSGVHLDWHRNNAWPEPFQSHDRNIVKSAFAPMAAAGWQIQNTLSHYHFDPKTQQLNNAGRAKLRWVLTHAPVHRRTVFVLRSDLLDDTEVRVDVVQQEIASIVARGPMPQVVRTHIAPQGIGGGQIYSTHMQFDKGRPAPILPAGNLGGGLGSGGQ